MTEENREAILDHIRMEMDGRENKAPEPTDIVCQNCGTRIVDDNTGDYIIHRVPEHGEDMTTSVFYCSRDCFNELFERLLQSDGGRNQRERGTDS